MILVSAKLKSSDIHGIGIFAKQFIPKGTKVWEFKDGFDLIFSKEQVDNFSEAAKEQILNYAYISKKTGNYILCTDDSRFFNHDFKSKLAEAIGLFPNRIDPNGSLSAGTNRDVAMDMLSVLRTGGIDCTEEEHIHWSTELFNRVAASLPFFPVSGVEETISRLKEKGLFIGLSTADTVENAELFLKKTGILQNFDYIGADDGIVNPKPATDYMEIFCERFKLKPEEVAVIGDTMADMNFGINSGSGLIIGVLSGTGTTSLLKGKANIIIDSIANLFRGDKLIWEDM